MKQISLKFKRHIGSVSNISLINNNIEKLTLNFILGSFGVLALIYVFILGNMVSDIVARRSFEADARSLSNEVRDLELSYLSMSNKVDLTFSYSMGFKETKAVFATRKALGLHSLDRVNLAQNDL